MRFLYEALAPTLGRTVGWIMANMTSAELTYWRAMYRVRPFGLSAADRHAALVCSAATSPYRKKEAGPPSPDEYLPDWWGDRARAAEEARLSPGESAAALGAMLRRGQGGKLDV